MVVGNKFIGNLKPRKREHAESRELGSSGMRNMCALFYSLFVRMLVVISDALREL